MPSRHVRVGRFLIIHLPSLQVYDHQQQGLPGGPPHRCPVPVRQRRSLPPAPVLLRFVLPASPRNALHSAIQRLRLQANRPLASHPGETTPRADRESQEAIGDIQLPRGIPSEYRCSGTLLTQATDQSLVLPLQSIAPSDIRHLQPAAVVIRLRQVRLGESENM